MDLLGYRISEVVFTLSDFEFETDGEFQSSYQYELQIDVFGERLSEVPLPASAPLLVFGLGSIAALRRRAVKGSNLNV